MKVRGEKKESGRDSKKTLCLVIGSAKKGFSWKRARDWLEAERRGWEGAGGVAEGVFGGLRRAVNYSSREKEVCKGLLGSLIVTAPRAFIWLGRAHATKKGFLHLLI